MAQCMVYYCATKKKIITFFLISQVLKKGTLYISQTVVNLISIAAMTVGAKQINIQENCKYFKYKDHKH